MFKFMLLGNWLASLRNRSAHDQGLWEFAGVEFKKDQAYAFNYLRTHQEVPTAENMR